MGYTWHFQIVWDYRAVFVRGAIITAQITFWATLIGVTLGLALGLMRRSRVLLLRAPAATFTELFRSTPALVQLIWIYYSLPILTGLQMSNIVSVSLGLGLHTAAYFGEIFRAGVNSISKGQWDAARAIGMSYVQAMRRIILPQAVRRMIPPFHQRVRLADQAHHAGLGAGRQRAAARVHESHQQHLSAARDLHGGGRCLRGSDLSDHLRLPAARAALAAAPMSEPMIKVRNVQKRFGDLQVLKGINLDVARGEVVAIIDPSGSGKSTLLRCMNFLEEYAVSAQ